MTAPAKKWRVYGRGGIPVDYRSQKAAYEAVRAALDAGHRVTVRHWENGTWVLFERLQPAPPADSGEAS